MHTHHTNAHARSQEFRKGTHRVPKSAHTSSHTHLQLSLQLQSNKYNRWCCGYTFQRVLTPRSCVSSADHGYQCTGNHIQRTGIPPHCTPCRIWLLVQRQSPPVHLQPPTTTPFTHNTLFVVQSPRRMHYICSLLTIIHTGTPYIQPLISLHPFFRNKR